MGSRVSGSAKGDSIMNGSKQDSKYYSKPDKDFGVDNAHEYSSVPRHRFSSARADFASEQRASENRSNPGISFRVRRGKNSITNDQEPPLRGKTTSIVRGFEDDYVTM